MTPNFHRPNRPPLCTQMARRVERKEGYCRTREEKKKKSARQNLIRCAVVKLIIHLHNDVHVRVESAHGHICTKTKSSVNQAIKFSEREHIRMRIATE